MKLSRLFQRTAIALTMVSLLMSQTVLAAAPLGQKASPVLDIALGQAGTLQGQILDTQGAAQKDALVKVYREGKEVAQSKTGQDGRFSISGMNGGLYLVSTDGAAGVVRAWSHQTAPPSARNGLLLVPTTVVRGELPSVADLLTNPGAWIVGAMVGVVVGVAVTDSSDAS